MTSATPDFFSRVRARLTLDVPAELHDDNFIPRHGDHDLDRMAAVAAVRSSPWRRGGLRDFA